LWQKHLYIFSTQMQSHRFLYIIQFLKYSIHATCSRSNDIIYYAQIFGDQCKKFPLVHNCNDSMRNSACCSMHFSHFRLVMTFHKVHSSGSNSHVGDEAWRWNAAAVQCNCIENKPRCIGASGAYNRYV